MSVPFMKMVRNYESITVKSNKSSNNEVVEICNV
jgi:hypothetical protein